LNRARTKQGSEEKWE